MIPYTVIRSRRRTVSLEWKPEGLVVRAPLFAPRGEIDRLVARMEDKLLAQKRKEEERAGKLADVRPLTEAERKALLKTAKRVFEEKAAIFAAQAGVTYGKIAVRTQKTRWGSCTAAGDLNFNALLLFAPEEVLDYVVVHELCHRKVMDHSQAFYQEVEKILPGWRGARRWLREHGDELTARLPE